jgi:rhamnose utilization protein RhaD (predicted bifunctional aldolase and dehydrogenase)
MLNRWVEADELNFIERYESAHREMEKEVLRQAYSTRLLGAENDLTMHGGGNTSFKTVIDCGDGSKKRALYVKASGTPLSSFEPEHFVVMDLDFLEGIRGAGHIDDDVMAREFKSHQLIRSGRLPSIESLMHAFIPARVVDHTHPAAILKIVNRVNGRALLKECFENELAVIPCTKMGYDLADKSSLAIKQTPGCAGAVVAHHGLIVWGENAREVYDRTIDIINRAENFLSKIFVGGIKAPATETAADIRKRNFELLTPIIKKCLSQASQGIDETGISADKISLALLDAPDVLELINSPEGKDIICNPPMTPDYPMYMRILPVWADFDMESSSEKISSYVSESVNKHVCDYKDYLKRLDVTGVPPADLLPHVIVHPQTGAVCFGTDRESAMIIADFTRQAFSIRRSIAETGGVYESLPEKYLFDMQYRGYQQMKKHK